MNELVLDNYYGRFVSGDENVIKPIWDGIKGATKLYHSYRTPCITIQDLEQVGLISTLYALKRFNPNKGMKLRTWLIQVCNQKIVKELTSYNQYNTIPLSQAKISAEVLSNQDILDILMYKFIEIKDYEPSYVSDEYFFKMKAEVSKRLFSLSNRMAYDVFTFIVENPGCDNSYIFNNLNISSTAYRKYLKQVGDIVKEVIDEF